MDDGLISISSKQSSKGKKLKILKKKWKKITPRDIDRNLTVKITINPCNVSKKMHS